jgi:hypothetical protein
MPVFLDVLTMPSIDNEKLQELIGSKDEFDVTPINILFNREADLLLSAGGTQQGSSRKTPFKIQFEM